MNGIVTGKQEKQAGSLVFKTSRTFTLPTYSQQSLSEALTSDEVNNGSVRIIGQNGKIAIISLFSLYVPYNYSGTHPLLRMRGLADTTDNAAIECGIAEDMYGNKSFGCTPPGFSSVATNLKSIEIGTLE